MTWAVAVYVYRVYARLHCAVLVAVYFCTCHLYVFVSEWQTSVDLIFAHFKRVQIARFEAYLQSVPISSDYIFFFQSKTYKRLIIE